MQPDLTADRFEASNIFRPFPGLGPWWAMGQSTLIFPKLHLFEGEHHLKRTWQARVLHLLRLNPEWPMGPPSAQSTHPIPTKNHPARKTSAGLCTAKLHLLVLVGGGIRVGGILAGACWHVQTSKEFCGHIQCYIHKRPHLAFRRAWEAKGSFPAQLLEAKASGDCKEHINAYQCKGHMSASVEK